MLKKRNAVINLDLDDRDEYINQYDDDKISDELHNYIIKEAMKIDNSSRIVIRVNMNFEVNDEEKKKLRRMLMRDFDDSINNREFMVRHDNVRNIYLTLIGISCLIISFLFSYLNIGLISEVFMIIGWVSIWEIVDDVLFEKTEWRLRKRKYMQLKRAKIVFE